MSIKLTLKQVAEEIVERAHNTDPGLWTPIMGERINTYYLLRTAANIVINLKDPGIPVSHFSHAFPAVVSPSGEGAVQPDRGVDGLFAEIKGAPGAVQVLEESLRSHEMPGAMCSGRYWCELLFPDIQVLDPDGWRRGDGVDLDTQITREDFLERFYQSTIGPMPTVAQMRAARQVDEGRFPPVLETVNEYNARLYPPLTRPDTPESEKVGQIRATAMARVAKAQSEAKGWEHRYNLKAEELDDLQKRLRRLLPAEPVDAVVSRANNERDALQIELDNLRRKLRGVIDDDDPEDW